MKIANIEYITYIENNELIINIKFKNKFIIKTADIVSFIIDIFQNDEFIFKDVLLIRPIVLSLRTLFFSYCNLRSVCFNNYSFKDDNELFEVLFDIEEYNIFYEELKLSLFELARSLFDTNIIKEKYDVFNIKEWFLFYISTKLEEYSIIDNRGNILEESVFFDLEIKNILKNIIINNNHIKTIYAFEKENKYILNVSNFSCNFAINSGDIIINRTKKDYFQSFKELRYYYKNKLDTITIFNWKNGINSLPVLYKNNKRYELNLSNEFKNKFNLNIEKYFKHLQNEFPLSKTLIIDNKVIEKLINLKPIIKCYIYSLKNKLNMNISIIIDNKEYSIDIFKNITKKLKFFFYKNIILYTKDIIQCEKEYKGIIKERKKNENINSLFLGFLRRLSLKGKIIFKIDKNIFDQNEYEKNKYNIKEFEHLREYQKNGVLWLHLLRSYGMSGILADDMGLGKTIQILSYFELLRNKNRSSSFIIICPASVIYEWVSQNKKFKFNNNIIIYHGAVKSKKLNIKDKIVITSYHTLKNSKLLLSKKWDIAVIDEAQLIKNSSTKIAKACKKLEAEQKIALTGTPIENSILDLWSIMDFCLSGYLGTKREFLSLYKASILEKDLKDLKDQLRPFILKRDKRDPYISKTLPKKIEYEHKCLLTDEQQEIYNEIMESYKKDSSNISLRKKGIILLEIILRCKQLCNHPLFFTDDKTIKNRSAKLEAVEFILSKYIETQNKILIFSQFAQTCEILKERFSYIYNEYSVFYLSSSLSLKKRKLVVEEFNNAKAPAILILTLGVGGFGLNLQTANVVIHYDKWWNPAREDQSTDRAYRIGQLKNVHVHNFITLNTVEERIEKIQKRKRKLYNDIIEFDSAISQKLTIEELEEIIGEIDKNK